MSIESLAGGVLAVVGEASLRSLVLLAVVGLTLLRLRRASAALRHLVLLLALSGLLCLPLLSAVLPAWKVALPAHPAPSVHLAGPLPDGPETTLGPTLTAPPSRPALASPPVPLPGPAIQTPPRPRTLLPWRACLVAVWLVGVGVSLLPLLMGVAAVRRLGRRCAPVTDGALSALLSRCAVELGLRRPVRVLQGREEAALSVPMTWGLFPPVVLLPAGAEAWPAERQRAVLLHELAHVRRGDWLWQWLGHLACACYWFHPGVWWLVRQMRAESESACDDMVLSVGIPAAHYAGHLVNTARALSRAQTSLAVVPPMAQMPQVESRVRNILHTERKRTMVARRNVFALAMTALGLLLPLASLRPVSGAQQPSLLLSPASAEKQFAVVVDAGHGGQDTGTVAPDGTREKDINLAVARKLNAVLTGQGVRVIMTRADDATYLPIMPRAAFVKANRAQYLVSIHCNYHEPANSQSGVIVYYHGASSTGRRLATDIFRHITQATALPGDGALSDTTRFPPGGFGILRGSPVPSVLVECGFMNNTHDLAALRDNQTQQKIAEGIADGLNDYVAKARANAQVSAVHAVPGEMDANRLASEGRELTAEQAQELKRQSAARPDDLALRIKLLGYYGIAQYRSVPARTAYQTQVFWLIQNHPESVLLGTGETLVLKRQDARAFEHGKALWLSQVAEHPGDTVILSHAATYMTLSDEPTAEGFLKQLIALEPKSPQPSIQLGQLYQLYESDHHGLRPDAVAWAQKALAQYEHAATLLAPQRAGSDLLTPMAMTAYDSGAYDKAHTYAQALLDEAQKSKESVSSEFFHADDDATHHGNLILGRLALRQGDTAEAKARLLAMGRVSASPVLGSFGPNMRLAQDLLEHGDRQVVLEYFGECAKFWKNNNGQLAQWKTQVERGQTPDFGGNLVY